MERTPTFRVTETELRQRFNQGLYWQRAQSGEFMLYPRRDKYRSPPPVGEPLCTRSQLVVYIDADGQEVARVYQYLRPDGTLGASGRPDPKWLFENGVIYFV